MRVRDILKDGIIYAISNGLQGVAGIAVVLIAARYLSSRDLGILELLLATAMFVRLLVPLEISQSPGVFCAQAETDRAKDRYAGTALWFSVAAYALFFLVAASGASCWSSLLVGDAGHAFLLLATAGAAVAGGLLYHLQSQLRWNVQTFRYGAVTVGNAVTLIILVVFLFEWTPSGIFAVPYGLLLSSILWGIAAWFLCAHVGHLCWDRGRLREMLAFSLPLVPSSLSVFLLEYFDRLAIRQMLSFTDVGVYAVASRIAMVVNFAIIGFQGALMPRIFRDHEAPDTAPAIGRTFRYFWALAAPVLLGLTFFSPELIRLVAGSQYAAGISVVPLLAISIVFGRLYVFAPGLALRKMTRRIAWINMSAAALNAVLNVVLLAIWPHIVMAAAATAFSAIAAFTALWWLGQQVYPVPLLWRGVLRVFFPMLVIAVGWNLVCSASSVSCLILKLIVCCFASGVAILVILGPVETRIILRLLCNRWSRSA